MKLAGREAAKYFQRPDPNRAGLLIYGADTMRVALKRQEVIAALIGKAGEEEMRLSRISAADLRKDPAMVMDALKAVGFFPGPRAVFVEEATDGLAAVIEGALNAWAPGDAQLVVTAGQLTAKAKLRLAFEKHPNAYAAGLYDDPPSRDEIEAELARAGLPNIAPGAMTDLVQLANDLTPGDFRQTLEKIALYKLGDAQPVASEDVLACAPASTEADMDDMLNIVAEGHTAQIGPLMQRLAAQGVQPVGLCIALPGLLMVHLLKRKRDEYDAFLGKLESFCIQQFKKDQLTTGTAHVSFQGASSKKLASDVDVAFCAA